MDMKALADKLLKLQPDRRRLAHLALCEYSLRKWHDYTSRRRKIRYAESVCGTWQKVDLRLPDDAFESAGKGDDSADVARRYGEPIAAMHDDDLKFPDHIEFAYYSIYNLFRKYVEGDDIDDWLIANQALASEEDGNEWKNMLSRAIEMAIDPDAPDPPESPLAKGGR